MSTGKIIVGVVAGMAMGALLGVLFAPAKGATTRKRIVRKGEDYADALKEKVNGFVEDISDKLERAKEDVTKFAEKKMKSAKA
jgi:gas vesicle protein